MTGREKLVAWWRARSGREQRLLLVMGGLAAVLLVWLLVVRPVGDWLADARRRAAEAEIAAAQAEAQAETIRRIERSVPRRTGQPLPARIAAMAERDGLALTNVRPEGDGVAFAVAAVRPPVLLAWIARMEAEGLVIERFAARGNPDRTVAAEIAVRGRR
ncbi:type II secretion system protein GspM [Sphingomonas jatrophae]|uniref:General secretion pathway protein M n=1 Tax=Sphingomonas jatrophae TaxID=1166337 RepID=A0A1I6JDK0_9SPHN|nr:type II secretion system protein GspM [Sphingomonas jatrophae]SFR76934.1 general secretion pathway protein M [Sphingomonas jatrophae]